MSRLSKGDWVRYSGPHQPFGEKLGQVDCHYNRSMVMVNFIDGHRYGCWPQFLTKVYKRTAAVEVAKHAFNIQPTGDLR